MEKVEKYVSKDGKEFDSASECVKHEEFFDKLNGIMSILPKRPKDPGCKFANGHGYIQHKKSTVEVAMRALLEACDFLKSYMKDDIRSNPFSYRNSTLGRIIYEHDSIVKHHWYRFMCMDEKFREYGQACFGINPHTADGECLNK